MDNTKYTLRYLPLFYEDLEKTVVYIAETLENPQAANDLLDAVEKAILERLPVAEAFEQYNSLKERKFRRAGVDYANALHYRSNNSRLSDEESIERYKTFKQKKSFNQKCRDAAILNPSVLTG